MTGPHSIHNSSECAIRAVYPRDCFMCGYSAQIGYCWFPENIQQAIQRGEAAPIKHDYTWPEREAHYKQIFCRPPPRKGIGQ